MFQHAKHIVVVTFIVLTTFMLAKLAQSQQPPTPDAYLLSHGVNNDPLSLRRALMSSDPELRGFVASVLAQAGYLNAIPDLQAALKREENPVTRLHLAAALNELKGMTGYQALLSTCRDKGVRPTLRIQAAAALQEKGDQDCFNDVLKVSEKELDPQTQDLALRYFSRVMDAPDDKRQRLQAVLVRNLHAYNPDDRERAGEALTRFGDPAALQSLEVAATAEKGEQTKQHLQTDVVQLRQRIQSGGKPR